MLREYFILLCRFWHITVAVLDFLYQNLYQNLLFQNRDGNIHLSPGTSQSQMIVNFSALKEMHEYQNSVQQLQPALWKEKEAQATDQTKEDKTRNSTPALSEWRVKQNEQAKGHHSTRQVVTSLNAFTDSSVNIKNNGSGTSSSSGEKSKNCFSKKYIPKVTETVIANDEERGEQSRLQMVDHSGTDIVESVSEIQESIQSIANT